MAENRTMAIGTGFNIDYLVKKITETYRLKGYETEAFPFGNGIKIIFSKNTSFIYNIIGMSEGIELTLLLDNDLLHLSYGEEKWSDKIIAFVIGWFCCWITWITGGIGIYNQYKLSKNISNDISLLL